MQKRVKSCLRREFYAIEDNLRSNLISFSCKDSDAFEQTSNFICINTFGRYRFGFISSLALAKVLQVQCNHFLKTHQWNVTISSPPTPKWLSLIFQFEWKCIAPFAYYLIIVLFHTLFAQISLSFFFVDKVLWRYYCSNRIGDCFPVHLHWIRRVLWKTCSISFSVFPPSSSFSSSSILPRQLLYLHLQFKQRFG